MNIIWERMFLGTKVPGTKGLGNECLERKVLATKSPGTDATVHQLHICCTMRVNDSFTIGGNVEFFGCGM